MNTKKSHPRLKRALIILVVILVALPLVGLLYQFTAGLIDAQRYPPPGQMVDMGGYKLHLYCQGEANNKPTVVMDAGMGGTVLDWSRVTPKLTLEMRVCIFDRAGMGWSDASPLTPSTANRNAELHTLLQKAGIPPPYIMVGHSLGGAYALAYFQHYPDETAGLVLVDPGEDGGQGRLEKWAAAQNLPDAQRFQNIYRKFKSGQTINPLAFVAPFTPLGAMRVYLPFHSMPNNFPSELQDEAKTLMARNGYLPELVREQAMLSEIYASTYEQDTKCGNRPVIVLSSKLSTQFSDPDTALVMNYFGHYWTAEHEKLAACSTQGQRVSVSDSGHYIQLDRPDRVISAIRQVAAGISN